MMVLLNAAAGCSGGGSTGPNPAPTGATIGIDPRGMTLPVGGVGQLNARVLDAAGAPVSGVSVSWTSRNSQIASVAGGTVEGNSIGVATVVATAGSQRDSVTVLVIDNFTLEVTPPAASVQVGQSAQFRAIARDGSGNPIPLPPVAWTSSSPATASISNAGLAMGRAGGISGITATALRVTSPPATLQVTDPNAPCGGITNVPAWDGQIDYGFKVVKAMSDGGFEISADDMGRLTATLTLRSTGPFLALWHGDTKGSASITQKKESGNTVSTLSGGGSVQPDPLLGPAQMSLIVNLQNCTYRVITGAVISATLTESYGAITQVQTVAQIVFAGPLGAWQTLNLSRLTDAMEAHSFVWAGLNPDKDVLLPQGFVLSLFENSGSEASVGTASGGFLMLQKR